VDLRCRKRSFYFFGGLKWGNYRLRVGRLLAGLSARKGCILVRLWLGYLKTYGYRPLSCSLVESFAKDLCQVCDYTIVSEENIMGVAKLAFRFEGVVFLFQLFNANDF
jgi:hypothetical protein